MTFKSRKLSTGLQTPHLSSKSLWCITVSLGLLALFILKKVLSRACPHKPKTKPKPLNNSNLRHFKIVETILTATIKALCHQLFAQITDSRNIVPTSLSAMAVGWCNNELNAPVLGWKNSWYCFRPGKLLIMSHQGTGTQGFTYYCQTSCAAVVYWLKALHGRQDMITVEAHSSKSPWAWSGKLNQETSVTAQGITWLKGDSAKEVNISTQALSKEGRGQSGPEGCRGKSSRARRIQESSYLALGLYRGRQTKCCCPAEEYYLG